MITMQSAFFGLITGHRRCFFVYLTRRRSPPLVAVARYRAADWDHDE